MKVLGWMLVVIGNLFAISQNIRLNQIGFYTQGPKTAAVINASADDFYVISVANNTDTVYQGKLGTEKTWDASQEKIRLADFSSVVKPGQYFLAIANMGSSFPFSIEAHPFLNLNRGAARAYYYNRSSINLETSYAGKWTRPLGHPDDIVYVHSSAESDKRPAETVLSSPGGWYDAGDYNKYVVNSGISTYTLFAAYRHFPALYDTLNLNIPESKNALPDLLDETLWNFRWMMTMQDPNDGGVYHKLTSADFSGFIMPNKDFAKRYVVQKSVTASLDFAATSAYAARLFRKFEKQLPGFADSALAASRKAWAWSRAHPTAYYNQTQMNITFAPPISTGEYGDKNASDEFQWAGAELYLATKEDSFFTLAFPNGIPATLQTPGWPSVAALGIYSLSDEANSGYSKIDSAVIHKCILTTANNLRKATDVSAIQIPMGTNEMNWGSNSQIANEGILMLQAWKINGDTSLVRGAIDVADYLLGRNGPSTSYVTGYGSKSPLHPHHRVSVADGIVDPVPGFLVGGANPGQQDGCTYPSKLPALSWLDSDCSYASNEVTINWNAPLVYLAGALESIYANGGAGQVGVIDGRGIRGEMRFSGKVGARSKMEGQGIGGKGKGNGNILQFMDLNEYKSYSAQGKELGR